MNSTLIKLAGKMQNNGGRLDIRVNFLGILAWHACY